MKSFQIENTITNLGASAISQEQKFWVSLRKVRQELPPTFAKTQSPSYLLLLLLLYSWKLHWRNTTKKYSWNVVEKYIWVRQYLAELWRKPVRERAVLWQWAAFEQNPFLKLNPERNLRKCPPLQSQYIYTYFMISLR